MGQPTRAPGALPVGLPQIADDVGEVRVGLTKGLASLFEGVAFSLEGLPAPRIRGRGERECRRRDTGGVLDRRDDLGLERSLFANMQSPF